MLFAYRTGKSRITAKVWLKLEAAERAAGIGSAPAATTHFHEDPPGGFVVSEGEVKYRVEGKPKIYSSRLEEITAQVAAIQEELAAMAAEPPDFTLEELIFWMKQAHSWPPDEDDRKRPPGDLWKKYGP